MADISYPSYIAPATAEWTHIAVLTGGPRLAILYTTLGYDTASYKHRLYYHPYDDGYPPQPGTAVLIETLPDYEFYTGMGCTRLQDGTIFLLTARRQAEVVDLPPPTIVDYHTYLEYRLSRDDGETWSAPTAIISDYYEILNALVWTRPNGGVLLGNSRIREASLSTIGYDHYTAGNVDASGAWSFDASGAQDLSVPSSFQGQYPLRTGEQVWRNRIYGVQSTGRVERETGYQFGSSPVGAIYGLNHGNPHPFIQQEGILLQPAIFEQASRYYQNVLLYRWQADGQKYEWDSTTSSVDVEATTAQSPHTGAMLHVDETGVVWMWYITTSFTIRLVSCRSFQAGRLTNTFS